LVNPLILAINYSNSTYNCPKKGLINGTGRAISGNKEKVGIPPSINIYADACN
jgi:hypothetical protein